MSVTPSLAKAATFCWRDSASFNLCCLSTRLDLSDEGFDAPISFSFIYGSMSSREISSEDLSSSSTSSTVPLSSECSIDVKLF